MSRFQPTTLTITYLRPGALLAQYDPGQWCSLVVACGVANCMISIAGIYHELPWLINLLLGIIGFGCLIIGPLLKRRAEWLNIDLPGGWIHWRRRSSGGDLHESFSPQRVQKMRLRRSGPSVAGLCRFTLELEMDHPRLRRLVLGRWCSRNPAEASTRRIAAALGAFWLDDHQLLHTARAASQFKNWDPIPLKSRESNFILSKI